MLNILGVWPLGLPLATPMPRPGSIVVSHTSCLKVQVLDLSFNLFTNDVVDILCHMVQHVRDEYRLRGAFDYGGKMQGADPWVRCQFREAQIRYDNEVSDGSPYTGLFTIELFFLIATRIFVNKVACFFQYLHFSSPGCRNFARAFIAVVFQTSIRWCARIGLLFYFSSHKNIFTAIAFT